jgi:hypothetical protein
MSEHLNLESTSSRDAADDKPSRRWARTAEPVLQDVHLTDYVRVLYKRRWAAAAVFFVVVLAVVVYAFTATPIYEALTTRPNTTFCRAGRWRARRWTI